ncbi:NirD/YgiW/YdeI family stress tolerance protein [Mesorhizobium sp. VNQ89]|uniref:NirD/YgiW/YdeI family stress tolerance protein n=1 Tax=Mesorhizobium quangtriensis TaxID=3157709 RepID=UPI0032B7BB8A
MNTLQNFSRRSAAKMFLGISVALVMATSASAQFTGDSVGSSRVAKTVEQAKSGRIGRDVSLTGHIVKHLHRDHYLFRDNTGEIRVEIEPILWRGRRVNPDMTVRLRGDVDRDFRGRYISVERMQILK